MWPRTSKRGRPAKSAGFRRNPHAVSQCDRAITKPQARTVGVLLLVVGWLTAQLVPRSVSSTAANRGQLLRNQRDSNSM